MLSGGIAAAFAGIKITDFLETAGEDFVSVHRYYVVNIDYVSELKRYAVVMTDGSEIPIPVKNIIR
ncbi:MAG: LytTR family transcriptional regulator DNA-binding domain-containing protein [Porcipelethomonas sp.]